MFASCASGRSVRQGCGVWCGLPTGSCVQQACLIRHNYAIQATSKSGASRTANTPSGIYSSSDVRCGSNTEASSGSRQLLWQQQHTSTELQRVAGARGSVSVVAAAGPEGAATPAALHPPSLAGEGFTLHKPYSHLVQNFYDLTKAVRITIASALCTDIEALQFARGSCPVQVSFVNHPADWDMQEYVRQHPVMQQLQQVQQWVAAQASDSAAGSTTQFLGPFEAVLNYSKVERLRLTEFLHLSMLRSIEGGAPHAVVLHERLISSEEPHFLLHTMPVAHEAGHLHKNCLAQMVSRAGEGPGLQVFPGSVPEVAPAGSICSGGNERGAYYIPRALVCSQLPADTTYPLMLTVILMDSPGQLGQSSRQLGRWQVKASQSGRNLRDLRIRVNEYHKLAEYVGYSVAKAALVWDPTQGARLTLTLADTAEQP